MTGRPSLYAVLQVHPRARPEVIHAAFRALVRAAGRHPDLGGDPVAARLLIEAYRTLSDPDRRRAYDRWRRAHAGPLLARVELPPGLGAWFRLVLPEYRDDPAAPLRDRFNLVLARRGLVPGRVYVRAVARLTRAVWPGLFVLCRAAWLGRSALWPSTDVFVLAPEEVGGLQPFLREAVRQFGASRWNRCVLTVLTLEPRRLHAPPGARLPRIVRRLQQACD